MKKTINKPAFKKGDKVRIIGNTNDHDFPNGEIVIIEEIRETGEYKCYYLDYSDYWFVKESDMELVESKTNHPLIITKQTKERSGKKYYTWQMSKNKKVVNHQYNSAAGRNKQLNQFIEDIKSGNYEIK